jgi:hypothetical protein
MRGRDRRDPKTRNEETRQEDDMPWKGGDVINDMI